MLSTVQTDQNRHETTPEVEDTTLLSGGLELPKRVVSQQIALMFTMGRSGSIVMFLILIACWGVFLPYVKAWTILPLLLNQAFAQLYFNRLRALYLKSDTAHENPIGWADRYARGCMMSGLTWGLAGLMWLPTAPFVLQALFAIVMYSLCIGSVLSRHTYPPAMWSYVGMAWIPTSIGLLLAPNDYAQFICGLGFLCIAFFGGWTRTLQKNNADNIRLQFENSDLADAMVQANTLTKQKHEEAKAAWQEAKDADSRRQDFLNMVVRQFDRPLTNLATASDVLGKTILSEEQTDLVGTMRDNGRILKRLISDIADLSSLTQSSLKLRPQSFNPAELTQDVVQLLRLELFSARLSIEVDLSNRLPSEMYADPDRVKQVIINLIAHASRHLTSGGVILHLAPVAMHPTGEAIRFSISATDTHMNPDGMAHVLKVDQPLSDRVGDAPENLDLALCGQLVQAMGGRIGVDGTLGGNVIAWFMLACDPAVGKFVHEQQYETDAERRILDLDTLYALEDRVGLTSMTQHLSETLGRVALACRHLETASSQADLRGLLDVSQSIKEAARSIGLNDLSNIAGALSIAADSEDKVRAGQLTQEIQTGFASGYKELSRAYPSLN
ncbi:MAG: hypothetical protein KUG61_10370 [Parvibaculaceae bacterium]|nr:hypothetical protein [Parvibaculaceae bacterium]